MKRRKALLVYSRWQYGGPPVLSNFVSNLTGSYEYFSLDKPEYEIENVYIGNQPGEINSTKQLSEVLLTKDYDIAVVSELDDCVIDIEVAKKLGKKLFLFNWDSNVNISSHLETNFRIFLKKPINISFLRTKHSLWELSRYCNVLSMDYGYGEMYPNIHCLFTPQDERIFKKTPESEKEYDVLFCGSIHMEERSSILNKLLRSGVNVKIAGGRWPRENTLENFEDYAKEFGKAKISLNFAASPYCRYSRKGRILEALSSGAMCITTYPDILKYRLGTWFEVGKHLAEFNLDNCVDVVKYYIKNEEERKQVAEAGYEHWKKTCSADVFWPRLFEIAGVE